jgi:hypothetical protein
VRQKRARGPDTANSRTTKGQILGIAGIIIVRTQGPSSPGRLQATVNTLARKLLNFNGITAKAKSRLRVSPTGDFQKSIKPSLDRSQFKDLFGVLSRETCAFDK